MKKFISSFLAVAFVVGCIPSVLAGEIDKYASADWEDLLYCSDKCYMNGNHLSYTLSRNKELTYKTVDSETGFDVVYIKDTGSKAFSLDSGDSGWYTSSGLLQFDAVGKLYSNSGGGYGSCLHFSYGQGVGSIKDGYKLTPIFGSTSNAASHVFSKSSGIFSLRDLHGLSKPVCRTSNTVYCSSILDIDSTFQNQGYIDIAIGHHSSSESISTCKTPMTFRVKVDSTKPKVLTVAFTDQYASVLATDSETGIKEYGISSVSSPNDIFWQTNQLFMINPKDSQFLFWAKDGVNNISEPFTLITDTTPPTAPTITHNGYDRYNASDVTVTIADGVDLDSGVDRTEYSIDGGSYQTYSSPFTVSNSSTISARTTDKVGNVSDVSTKQILIDKTAPNLTYTLSPSDFTYKNVDINFSFTDSGVGIDRVEADTGEIFTDENFTYVAQENGTYTFEAFDLLGNSKTTYIDITNIDRTPPDAYIDIDTDEIVPDKVVATIVSSDGESGIKSITLNGQTKKQSTADFDITENGTYTAHVLNNAGLATDVSFTVSNIDKTAPVIDSVKQANGKLEVLASDNLSGVYKFSFDGGSTFTDDNFIEDPTPALYSIVVSDNVGNLSTPFDYRVQTIVIDSGNSNLGIDNLPDIDLIGHPDVEEIRMSLNVVEIVDDNKILDDSLVAKDVLENETIEQALDISVIKTVVSTNGSLDETKLSELSSPIKISIENTSNLKKPTVIRIHNGVAEKLDTEVFGKDIIFETDKFSTYFITEEIRSPGGSGGSNGSTEDKDIDDIISDLNDDLDFTVDVTEPNQKVEVDLGLDLDELKKKLDKLGIDIDWILNSIIPYTKVNGEIIIAKISVYEDNKIYFIAPVVGTYSFCVNFKDFSDLTGSSQLTDVYYSTAREILKGTSADIFEPQTSVTRGMIIEILYRLTGTKYKATTNYFTDITPADYYFNSVNWGYENGFIKGTGDNKFSPYKSVTREDMAVISANIFDLTSKSKPTFSDFDLVSSYALESVAALSDNKIIVGFDNLFMPRDKTKRIDVSTVIHRLNRVLLGKEAS